MATLRQQILARPETLSDLEWAAEQRYHEAEWLIQKGHFAGSTYLLGLASEMWLKLACFRCQGHAVTAPVKALLGPARDWMRTKRPRVDSEQYHSLRFWLEYLIALRADRANAIPNAAIGEARHHVVSRLYEDWKIDLRYRIEALPERHVLRVYRDATWLRQRWKDLGRSHAG